MDPLNIALEYAKNGFHVFPLYKGPGNRSIKPYGWAKNDVVDPENQDKVIPATNNLDEIARWPELIKSKYNSVMSDFGILGLDCVIIDLDMKNGKDGFAQYGRMRDAYNIPSPTMFTISKSGGLHAFYRRPASMRDAHVKTIASVKLGATEYDGIDLRGNGGFVMGPNKMISKSSEAENGLYNGVNLMPISECPEFPESVLKHWTRAVLISSVDSMISDYEEYDQKDYTNMVRRGLIPKFIPNGARNETFYIFINSLKSKGIPREVCRQMCQQLATVCENPETLAESVDVEELMDRVYVIHADSPFDVAVDLVTRGIVQLTGHKSKIQYVILEDNPYISSRVPHDIQSLSTMLLRYEKSIQMTDGKSKKVNPASVMEKLITDESRADTLGFKPGAGNIFTHHDDPGSKRFLNTFKPIPILKEVPNFFGAVCDELEILIGRIFGAPGTMEFDLGMDFIAWSVQNPHIKPCIAPFVMSHQRGVGKSLLFDVIVRILGTSKDGERMARVTRLDELGGRFFNPTGCVMSMLDEVQFPAHRDTRKESVTFWRHLKNLITAETVPVEVKGGATFQMHNSGGLMLAGNSGSHFPIEEMDRRLWIIDANPPELERGTVDNLFNLARGGLTAFGPDDRVRAVNSLRHYLGHRKIVNDLSSIRAPMTDVKREMFMNSVTDIEEWFINHFETDDNLLSKHPIISKSAFLYVASTSEYVLSSRFRDNLEDLYRDLRRRGYLRPIRVKGGTVSRQFVTPQVGVDGVLYQNNKREILYTTREHGKYDNHETTPLTQMYISNLHTIRVFQGKIRKPMTKELFTAEESTNSM